MRIYLAWDAFVVKQRMRTCVPSSFQEISHPAVAPLSANCRKSGFKWSVLFSWCVGVAKLFSWRESGSTRLYSWWECGCPSDHGALRQSMFGFLMMHLMRDEFVVNSTDAFDSWAIHPVSSASANSVVLVNVLKRVRESLLMVVEMDSRICEDSLHVEHAIGFCCFFLRLLQAN